MTIWLCTREHRSCLSTTSGARASASSQDVRFVIVRLRRSPAACGCRLLACRPPPENDQAARTRGGRQEPARRGQGERPQDPRPASHAVPRLARASVGEAERPGRARYADHPVCPVGPYRASEARCEAGRGESDVPLEDAASQSASLAAKAPTGRARRTPAPCAGLTDITRTSAQAGRARNPEKCFSLRCRVRSRVLSPESAVRSGSQGPAGR